MKIASVICGALGILVLIITVIGRLHGGPTVTIFGSPSTHMLIVGNSLLLTALFLGQLQLPSKKL